MASTLVDGPAPAELMESLPEPGPAARASRPGRSINSGMPNLVLGQSLYYYYLLLLLLLLFSLPEGAR